MFPSLSTVESLIIHEQRGNCVPVYVELPADLLTPCMAYLRIAKDSKYNFLLESVVGGESVSRYSFIGAGEFSYFTISQTPQLTNSDPLKVIRTGPGEEITGDPMVALEKELALFQYVKLPQIPTFTGGAVGYISYDCIQHFEPKTACELKDTLNIPEAVFMLVDTLLIFDHIRQTIKVVSHVFCPNDAGTVNLAFIYKTAASKTRRLAKAIMTDAVPDVVQGPITLGNQATSNVGKEGYEAFVTTLKKHILAGDIIQAVPSQRLARPTALSPFNAYRHLRQVNPSPYMFYVDCGEVQIVGASPETLCKVENNVVYNHAIAGTIRRGSTVEGLQSWRFFNTFD